MINVHDLRVGNWILLGKEYERVYQIIFNRRNGHSINHKDYKEEFYEPINLTDEILEKCGFEKQIGFAPGIGEFYWYDNGIFETTIFFKNWIGLKGIDSIPIKYLHQLQNLIFALTGEELKVNL